MFHQCFLVLVFFLELKYIHGQEAEVVEDDGRVEDVDAGGDHVVGVYQCSVPGKDKSAILKINRDRIVVF